MNDPENFLARWSRRKREVGSGDAAPAPEAPASAAPATSAECEAEMAALTSPKDSASEDAASPAPVFDPASLPSLDSISAETDIRGFLAPGVPTELAHAALRRVWVADPGIRDFKGLAEYDWDFTAPNSMLGFGDLDPGTDVTKMLADVFGDKLPDLSASAEAAMAEMPGPERSTPLESLTSEWQQGQEEPIVKEVSGAANNASEQQPQDDLLRRDVDAAMQNRRSTDEDDQPVPRRQHGGALPQL